MHGILIERPYDLERQERLRKILWRGVLLAGFAFALMFFVVRPHLKEAEAFDPGQSRLTQLQTENLLLKERIADFLQKTSRLNELYESTLDKATQTASDFEIDRDLLQKRVRELEQLNRYVLGKSESMATRLNSCETALALPGSRRQTDPEDPSITREWIR